jgi:peptidoglycan DL-endopeptidase CwlO
VRGTWLSGGVRTALAGLAALVVLFAAAGAEAEDPGGQAASLRSSNDSLAAKSHQVLLELYSLQTRLGAAERRIDALEARSVELDRAVDSAKLQLQIARENMAAAHRQLGERLRQLYVEGDVDPLAVLLGADSLDDALSAIDGLGRLAQQDKDLLAQLTHARTALRQALSRLAARQAEVRALVRQAKAARADLLRTQSQQRGYLASLRRQQALNRNQIAHLNEQAAASEQQSQQLSSGSEAGDPPPTATTPPPPPPPPPSGQQMTVSSTGYCLKGTTAIGLPVGWGVIAVDPAVIPLGTRMFVPGYGEGVAADTGSAVRGANIDLWFPTCTQALQWGRRTVTVTIH